MVIASIVNFCTNNISFFVKVAVEESKIGAPSALVCFRLPLETYHILISSITAGSYMRILEYNDFMLDKQTHFCLYL